MTVLDLSVVNTEPGEGGESPFSPPPGWTGSAEDYRKLMRERFANVMHSQRMAVTARFAAMGIVTFSGPYTEQAREIINTLKPKSRTALGL